MDIRETQQKVLKLVRLAADKPTSEEGRTAGATACKLIAEHGLLVMIPQDLIPSAASPADAAPRDTSSHTTPQSKPRKRRPSAKEIRETVTTVADTVATGIDAAGRIVSAVNGLRSVARGG